MSWLRKLGFLPARPLGRDDLAREWNETGREFFKACSDSLTTYYEGGKPFEWTNDPRPLKMAQAVLNEVLQMQNSGEARRCFDPAHAPFIPLMEAQAQSIACVTALGSEGCLIRLGTDYQDGEVIHLQDDRLTPVPGLLAVTASRNHRFLLLVEDDGFHVRRHLTGADETVLPWPCEATRLDSLHLSDDGQRMAFAHDEHGIWVGDAEKGWVRLHPTDADIAELRQDMEDDTCEWSASMTHCALSPDGQFIAYGTQDHGHDIDRIDTEFGIRPWARINPDIDYPHDACFSDEGRYLSLNGCHFYNGATLVVDIPNSEGLTKVDYDPDPRTPMIEDMLRVYASTWLPPEATGQNSGAFVLTGAGIMTAVTPQGTVLFSQYFGSSASSIDYCAETRRLYLGSSSGILHVYDIDRLAGPEQAFGYKPRHELYRWTFWKDHPPFRW